MTLRSAAVAIWLFMSSVAAASGLNASGFGGDLGHPTVDHPTAAYFNPAGLALGSRTRVYLEGVIGFRYATYRRYAGAVDHPLAAGMSGSGTPADASSANVGRATSLQFGATPYLGITSDFGVKGLALGVAFCVPFGGNGSWEDNPSYRADLRYPGAVDGVQRWWNIDGQAVLYYFIAAAAYRIEKIHLSIGGAVNVIYAQLESLTARNANGTDDLTDSTGVPVEGRSYVKGDGVTASFSLGAIYQPKEWVFIGASYQAQPGLGSTTVQGSFDYKFGSAPVAHTRFRLNQGWPDAVRFGVRVRPPRQKLPWELRVSASYMRWSVFNRQCFVDPASAGNGCVLNADGTQAPSSQTVLANIERRWQDAGSVYASASIWPRPRWEVLFGGGWDGNAIPPSVLDPTIFDSDKLWATLGFRYTFARPELSILCEYTHIFYVDRRVQPGTGLAASLRPPSREPDAAGHYTYTFGYLNLGVGYRF